MPPELKAASTEDEGDWEAMLASWARAKLHQGSRALLDQATPAFEATMIRVALEHTGGRKRDAAELLGWGRNTLTRKLAELDMNA